VGTLSLVFGIFSLIAIIPSSMISMMLFPFPYGLFAFPLPLLILGIILIKKYDRDRKK